MSYYLLCHLCVFGTGFYNIKIHKVDYDYSKYLGSNHDQPEDKLENFSTYVANHTSYMDIQVMATLYLPAMVSKVGVKDIPLIGFGAELIGTIFVDRADSKNKNAVVDFISKRQHEILDKGLKQKVGIFPEGTVSNGKALLRYKSGAFASLLPVKPIFLKYKGKYFSPTYSAIGALESMILLFCQFTNNLEVYELPIFKPNEFLFEHHSYLGKDKA